MLLQFKNHPARVDRPKRIFISYSHRDQDVFERLVEALFPLRKEQLVECWHDRMLKPGEVWDRKIRESMESADLILFIVSPSFLASEYCQDTEVRRALELRKQGKAKIVPLLARPTQWWDHELAMMQALPPQARPLSDFPSLDDGIASVVDALRPLLLDGAFFRDDSATGLSSIWQLQLSPAFESDSAINVEQVVHRLVDWSKDETIRLIGYNNVPGKGGISTELVLVLEGTPEAFVQFENAQKEGRLEGIVGYPVKSFGRTVGSTMQTSSVVFNGKTQPPADYVNPDFKLLYPSKKYAESRLAGISMDPNQPLQFQFLNNPGDEKPDATYQARLGIQVGYFTDALCIREANMWVNLSAYESNRMIPKELAGTRLGYELLQFDVMLKQFTGSLVSPDTQIGRQFWKSVLEDMSQRHIPMETPIETFQKVWVTPSKAVVYEKEPNSGEDYTELGIPNEWLAAFVGETELEVKMEWDPHAARCIHRPAGQNLAEAVYMHQFEKIILPAISEEVNNNERFATLRQVYYAMILAAWVKKRFAHQPEFQAIIDSDNRKSIQAKISSIRLLQPAGEPAHTDGEASRGGVGGSQPGGIDHVNPSDEGFEIEENRRFYNQYIQLFRKGLSRCVRTMEINGRPCVRQYFSGGMYFEETNHVLQCRRTI